MEIELHKSEDRGVGDHGWLRSRHSFSFAGYHNPLRMGLGALRVLNEDTVEGGHGFGTHPHENMEIISIVLEGALEHRDSMGNSGVIHAGEVQRMSAGTGVTHSEFNHSKEEAMRFLQIWIYPNKLGIKPEYEQKSFSSEQKANNFLPVVSGFNEPGSINIHQEARLSLAHIGDGQTITYSMFQPLNYLYVFMMSGRAEIEGYELAKGDALAQTGGDNLEVSSLENSDILVIEVPEKPSSQ